MASVAGYVTAQQIVDHLGWRSGGTLLTLTTTSNPTIAIMEDMISDAEEYIEKETRRNWRSAYITITDEYHSWSYYAQGRFQRGYNNSIIIDLNFANVIDFATGEGDKIEIWDGASWIDLVATGTAGEAINDGDYFLEPSNGRLYLNSNWPAEVQKNIKITYRYGEGAANIPRDVRKAVRYLTNTALVPQYGSWYKYNMDDVMSGNDDSKIKLWRKEVDNIIKKQRRYKAYNLLS